MATPLRKSLGISALARTAGLGRFRLGWQDLLVGLEWSVLIALPGSNLYAYIRPRHDDQALAQTQTKSFTQRWALKFG